MLRTHDALLTSHVGLCVVLRGEEESRMFMTYVTCVTETALYEQNGVPACSRLGSRDALRPARARSPRVAEPTAQQRTLDA